MANQTTSIDYKHPYVSLKWEHLPSGGSWQDATLLSGYVSGQGTKTLELDGATPSETGHLRCALTIPDGRVKYSDLAALSATEEAPNITVGISEQTPYEGESATYGPITVTGSPTPTLLWEAETADGNNTWADADTVFGADGSGQGTDTYVIANTGPGDNRDVRVTATNTAGSDVSQAALTVTPKLAFTTDPQDQTILETVSGTSEYLIDFTAKSIGDWTHTRDGNASAPDESGTFVTYTDNQPAWHRDNGLLVQVSSTNLNIESGNHSAWLGSGTGGASTISAGDDVGSVAAWTHSKAAVADSGAYVTYNAAAATPTNFAATLRVKPVTRNSDESVCSVRFRDLGLGADSYQPSAVYMSNPGTWTWELDPGDRCTTIGGLPIGEWTTVVMYFNGITVVDNIRAYLYAGSRNTAEAAECQIIGPQFEQLSYTTSYIETAAAPVSRAVVGCTSTMAALGSPLPAGGVSNDFCGQVVCVLAMPSTTAEEMPIFSIGDTTDGVAIKLTGTTLTLTKYVGGAPTALTVTTPAYSVGETADVRYRISASGMTLWWNASATNSNANGTALAAPATTVTIDTGAYIAKQVRIVPEALSDNDITDWPLRSDVHDTSMVLRVGGQAFIDAGNTFTLPIRGGAAYGYQFMIKWGDGTTSPVITSTDAANPDLTHTYSGAGPWEVEISVHVDDVGAGGKFTELFFSNGAEKLKLLHVVQWGSTGIKRILSTFRGCSNATFTTNQPPTPWTIVDNENASYTFNTCTAATMLDLTFMHRNGGSCERTFFGCSNVELIIVPNWTNVGGSTLIYMCFGCSKLTAFTGPPGGLDTSSVGSFLGVFQSTSLLSGDVSAWQINSITSAADMWNGSALTNADWAAQIISWSDQVDTNAGPSGIALHGGSASLVGNATAEAARDNLRNTHGWTITDGDG